MRGFLILFLFSMSTLSKAGPNMMNFLTYEDAKQRAESLAQIHYKVALNLSADKTEYDGEVDIDVFVKKNENIFLDFSTDQSKIIKLTINNKPSSYRFEDKKIYIPAENLKVNSKNSIHIQFSRSFSKQGKGFHRFVDPEDKEVYIYSNLEPYFANEILPLFDQPDLKASYTLSVKAPKHWELITNTLESYKKDLNDNYQVWYFQSTAPMSSYVFALIAGPFKKWESKCANGLPLRLFARKTIAKHVQVEDWFAMTKNSFSFFEKEFEYPYPFKKYDQILVPEFDSGAMENIGAVTFNEDRFIQRGVPTPHDRIFSMIVIAHEMSHMWFGNLVTMKWWDDLWLNESFAEFMSFLAVEATAKDLNLLDPWVFFNSDVKFYSYIEDSYSSTTHPIVGTVRNTDEAFSSFDSITYRKGASALKQLYYFVGKEAFYKGLQSYFKKYEYSNTTRYDFLQALSKASGLDLRQWDEEWLRSKGTNSISVELKVSGDKIQSLAIKQNPDPMDALLRTHRTLLGLYKYDSLGKLNLYKTIAVTYKGALTEIVEAKGLEVPDLVFPNVMDYDLVNVTLDSKSLDSVLKSLSQIENTLQRQQLYSTLWFMVRNRDLSAAEFINLCVKHSVNEEDVTIMNLVMRLTVNALSYINKETRSASNDRVAGSIWKRLEKAAPGSALQTLLFDFMLSVATLDYSPKFLAWLQGKNLLKGLRLDQDRRWNLIVALSTMGEKKVTEIIEKEKQKDPSSRGILFAKIAEISSPDLSVKKKWYAELSQPGKLVSTDARELMVRFQNIMREDFTSFTNEDYFESILRQLKGKDFEAKVAAYATYLYPLTFPEDFEQRVKGFVKKNVELPNVVRKALLKRVEDSERVRLARTKFQ